MATPEEEGLPDVDAAAREIFAEQSDTLSSGNLCTALLSRSGTNCIACGVKRI